MRVEQLMSRDVVTVTPDVSLKEVAAILSTSGISGVPVCSSGRVVGVVSETDIVRKEQGQAGEPARLLAHLFGERSDEPWIRACTAGEAMSAPAITIDPSAPVSKAARLMIERQVNRLPVVHDGELVGIVTRADLVRAFQRTDGEIEREVADDVLLHTLWVSPDEVHVSVERGEVSVSGAAPTRTDAELIEVYVRRVPGVVDVHSNLTWKVDDRSRRVRTQRIPRRV